MDVRDLADPAELFESTERSESEWWEDAEDSSAEDTAALGLRRLGGIFRFEAVVLLFTEGRSVVSDLEEDWEAFSSSEFDAAREWASDSESDVADAEEEDVCEDERANAWLGDRGVGGLGESRVELGEELRDEWDLLDERELDDIDESSEEESPWSEAISYSDKQVII